MTFELLRSEIMACLGYNGLRFEVTFELPLRRWNSPSGYSGLSFDVSFERVVDMSHIPER